MFHLILKSSKPSIKRMPDDSCYRYTWFGLTDKCNFWLFDNDDSENV